MPGMRRVDADAGLNELSRIIVDAAVEVHRELGPGLMERVYQQCLAEVLRERGLEVRLEVPSPVVWRGRALDATFRLDMLVESAVVVEVKAVEDIHPVHPAQLYTYLKIGGYRLGLLLNFNSRLMRDGIRRIVCT